jgi:hypothetical protein
MKSGYKNKKAVLRWKIPTVWSITSKVMQLKYMCANVYMENDKNEKKIVIKTEKMFYLCKDYINYNEIRLKYSVEYLHPSEYF